MNLFKVVVLGVLTVAMLGSTTNSQVAVIDDKSVSESLAIENVVERTLALEQGGLGLGGSPDLVGFSGYTELKPDDDVAAETVCCLSAIGCYQIEQRCIPGDYTVSCPCPPVD